MSERPRRSGASKLTSEQIQDMFDSRSECSDDDPDFDFERNKKRGSASWLTRRDAASSSEEVDDPDENSDRKKKPRIERTPKTPNKEPGTGKKPVGRPRKNSTLPNEPSTPRSRGKPRKYLTSTPTSASPGQTPGPSSLGAPAQVAASPTAANGLSTPRSRGKPRKYLTSTLTSASPGQTPGPSSLGAPAQVAASPTTTNDLSTPRSRGRPRKYPTSTPTSASPGQTPGPSSLGAPAQVAASPTTANGSSQALVAYQPIFPVVEPVRRPAGEFEYFCCVKGCQSRDTSNKEGLWLFALPEDPEVGRIWEERLRIDHHRNRPKSPRVCFRHFDRDDYVGRRQRLTGLRQGALPKVETANRA